MDLVRVTSFSADHNGHGGNRRTAQIAELVNSINLEIQDVPEFSSSRFKRYYHGFLFTLKHSLKVSSYRSFGYYGTQFLKYQSFLKSYNGKKILLWEDTRHPLTSLIAQSLGFKVIALPQNIESLVSYEGDTLTQVSLAKRLDGELKSLLRSNAVFCISREEQWLLRLQGVNADFLPYYPPKFVFESLLEVRKVRSQSSKCKFLIIGTAGNSPTLLGMIEQIQWLQAISSKYKFQVDIAGYGTEQLDKHCNNPAFTVHGSVSFEKLRILMIRAKAVLIHQVPTSGALTRIPEMLIAGIPVIANNNACRSSFGYAGVYIYDNLRELSDLITKELSMPPILNRPLSAEKRFIDCVQQFSDS